MRWLLDQGLPRSAAAILKDSQEDAIHVGDIGMAESMDADIIHYALSEDRIIITLDADFHALLALARSSKPSVICKKLEKTRTRSYVIAKFTETDYDVSGCLPWEAMYSWFALSCFQKLRQLGFEATTPFSTQRQ